jgi:hypothetical protein
LPPRSWLRGEADGGSNLGTYERGNIIPPRFDDHRPHSDSLAVAATLPLVALEHGLPEILRQESITDRMPLFL